jgi:putative membrane-bound dehydrogenase-like protein
MVRSFVLALLAIGTLGCESARQTSVEKSDVPRRIEVLVTSRSSEVHDPEQLTDAMAAALAPRGINVTYDYDSTARHGQDTTLFDAIVALADDSLEFASLDDEPRRVTRIANVQRDAWHEPSFAQAIEQAILHVVSPQVVTQWRTYAVPPLVYVDQPVFVPNYENRDPAPRLQEGLTPEQSLKHWQVPPGFELQLFAAEPQIVNPIAMSWDERGRLWVVETTDYPNHIVEDGTGHDRILILEDSDRDGRADKSTVFADGLSIPTGIVFAHGGIIVSNAPRFLFLQDTTGDDRADVRRTIMTGWSTADTHGGPSNLQYGFDNWIYGSVGDAGFNGEVGGKRMQFEDAIYRFRPDGSELEVITRFTNNTWALGFSEAFDLFANTANNEHSVFIAIPNRYYDGVTALRGKGAIRLDGHYARHAVARTRQVDYFGGFTAAGGHSLYTARSFPREYWNRIAFVHEAIGGIVHRAIIEPHGSSFRERDGWNLIATADEWAAPVQAQVGPDGAVWILDWYSFIKQHNPTPPGFQTGAGAAYDTPLRDKQKGRIYRLVWKGAPAYEPLALNSDDPHELVDALKSDNMFWRMTAQRLLVQRGRPDVIPDLLRIIGDRHVDAVGLNAPAIHALWTLHGLGALDGSDRRALRAAQEALRHPSAAVRKNALMVLPRTTQLWSDMLDARSFTDRDYSVRLRALLAAAELPPKDSIGRALFGFAQDSTLLHDPWLPAALFLAARKHETGFLAAYQQQAGNAEFARMTQRAQRGELEQVVNWSAPAVADATWDTVRVPAHWINTKLANFPGVVWFRTQFNVPPAAAGRAAKLYLGPISDIDVSYVNGVRVGSMDNVPGERRVYDVPRGVLNAGSNTIAVEVTNQRRGGGIYGVPDSVFVAGDGFRIPLAGFWKYRKAAEWQGGRAPDFTPGIPFEQQFLRLQAANSRTVTRDAATAGPKPDVTLTLAAVPGQNRFDRVTLDVRAGQRVAIAFRNPDGMAHNVVVLSAPARQQDVGAQLNAYVSDASAAGRDFLPPSLPVLARTPMVTARDSATLIFTAPAQPGSYPFLCSVPGHWVTMWGVVRVR